MVMTAAAFAVLVLVVVAATAALFVLVVVVVAAAALALVVVVMVVAAAPATFVLVVVVMAAATFSLAVIVVMVVAAPAPFVLMVVVVAAAALALVVVVMVVAAAPAPFVLVVVVMTAAAFAVLMVVMMVMVAAAAGIVVVTAAAAPAAMDFTELDRVEGRLGLGHLQADHLEHLGEVRQRQDREAFLDLGDAHAAVDEGAGGFAQHVEVARDVKDLLNGRTDGPEGALVVEEHIVHFDGAELFGRNGERHVAFGRVDRCGELGAFGRGERQRVGAVEDGLSRSSLGGQKLRKRGHGA